MNAEICKDCKNNCFLIFTNQINKIIVTNNIDHKSLRNVNKIFYHNDNGEWKMMIGIGDQSIVILTEKDFIKITELDKDCPYYAEHQLYNWNQ